MPGISGKFRVGYTAKDTKKGGGAITGSTHSGTNVTQLIYRVGAAECDTTYYR